MDTVLFCWELGAGFGHLTPHREVLRMLHERGCQVHVVVRDVIRAAKAFEGLPFHYWQAPTPQHEPLDVFYRQTANFAQILHNTGLAHLTGLSVRLSAWRNLIAAIRPRIALVDYCPSALLALRDTGIPTVVTGTGFFIPPNLSPFPPYPNSVDQVTHQQLVAEEERLLQIINPALQQNQIAPLNCLAQMFHDVTARIFRSLPEFDHYPNRPDRNAAEFLGLPPDPPRPRVEWPSGNRPRVFAYLKPFAALESLLDELKTWDLRVIVAGDGLDSKLCAKHASSKMKFAPPTIDVAQMGREARFAITNANLTTSVRLVLEGCPVLLVPLSLEQGIVADNFRKLGVSLVLDPKAPTNTKAIVSHMLDNPKYRKTAREVAARYARRPRNYSQLAFGVMESILAQSAALGSTPQSIPQPIA